MTRPRDAADPLPQWQVPDYLSAKPTTVAGWVNEIVQQCESNLKATLQYKDVGRGYDLIAGKPDDSINEQRSSLNTNRAKRSIREIVAALSDVRQVDGYDSENSAFKSEGAMLNKAMRALYYERNYDLSIRRAVQWFTVTGTSFIWPCYRKVRMGPGADAALCFDSFGLIDCMPYMKPADGDNQGSYANIIVKMVPLPQLHSMFPAFQDRIKPMSKRRYDNSVANKRMSLAEMFRHKTSSGKMSWEGNFGELRMMLVRDMRINATGVEIPIGVTGDTSSYTVPYIGQDIPSMDVSGGVRRMRKAGIDDCYLFPYMRLIMTIDGLNVPVFDSANSDWSAMMPAEFTADSWPWERLGYSLIRDIYDLERARQHGERAMDMVIRHRMDPSISYDSTRVPTKTAETFDPWRERGRLGVEGEVDDKSWRTTLPKDLLDLPEASFKWQEYVNQEQDYLLGLNAISSMAKAKLGVSGDAMEKLLELAGPLVKDISRCMEPPTRDAMEISKFILFQRYDTRRLMSYVGPDGITPVTLDFEPDKLYPSHMPGEDTTSASAFTARERARHFATNLHLQITPNSLHAVTQTAQKLLYLQLWRAGFPISPVTVAKALDLANFGTVEGNTEIEQWQNWKKMEIEFMAQAKELAGSLEGMAQPPAGPGPGGGPRGKGGRPPSGKKPAHLETKGSAEGPRAVIAHA